MALIGKIRNNSWLLIVLIGLGLGGFVIMDMFSGQQSIFGSRSNIMAEIEGTEVDIREFNQAESILYTGQSGNVYNNRNQLWNFFVEEALVNKEAEALGLGVSKKEIQDLEFGSDNKLSPIILARYPNPQNPRAVDRAQLNEIKGIIDGGASQMQTMIEEGRLNPNFPFFWDYQRGEIKKERLQSKLIKMVEKSLYTPTWMAEMLGNDQNARVDFVYVQVPFDNIENDAVSLADEDYQRFLEQNSSEYSTDEETRKVEYVVFDVFPSAIDSATISDKIAGKVEAFESAENDSTYVNNNFGTINQVWHDADMLSNAIKDTVFQIPVGSVYGPYVDNNTYKAVKVMDRQVMRDSAKCRHILIAATTPAEFETARKRCDSLKTVIETGQNVFDTLVVQFSDDPGSKNNGGVYDYAPVNQYVPEFNDVVFYSGQIGRLYSVRTQFGYHLIEPMGRQGESKERVRVAYISENIEPSEKTQDEVRSKALDFLDANPTRDDMIKSAAASEELDVETSPALKRNDYAIGSLGSGNTSRDIVRWAFNNDPNSPNAEVGGVAPEVYAFQDTDKYYTGKYAVVALKSVQEAGIPSVANVKDDPDMELKVMNMKKGEMLMEQIGDSKDLAAIANQFGMQVDTAKNVSFSGGFIPNLGQEPKVVASAFSSELNTVAGPMTGNSGVYLIMPTYKPTATNTPNIPQTRQTSQTSSRSQISARLMQAIRKEADISDNRARFF